VLELQVAEDDDLFNTEEPTGVRDSRIVVEKSPERESKLESGMKEKSKKIKKREKRKIDEGKEPSSSGSDDEEKGKDKERNVKTKYVIFNVLIRLVYNGLLLTYIQLIRPEKFVWFQIDWTIFKIFYIYYRFTVYSNNAIEF
jgi:hypothetical protein